MSLYDEMRYYVHESVRKDGRLAVRVGLSINGRRDPTRPVPETFHNPDTRWGRWRLERKRRRATDEVEDRNVGLEVARQRERDLGLV